MFVFKLLNYSSNINDGIIYLYFLVASSRREMPGGQQELQTLASTRIFILVINQFDTQNFYFTISLFHASTCFEHNVLIIRRSKLHYTVSGNITPVGGRPVHQTAIYRCDDTRGCTIQF